MSKLEVQLEKLYSVWVVVFFVDRTQGMGTERVEIQKCLKIAAQNGQKNIVNFSGSETPERSL